MPAVVGIAITGAVAEVMRSSAAFDHREACSGPSWVAQTATPLARSIDEPPPTAMMPSHSPLAVERDGFAHRALVRVRRRAVEHRQGAAGAERGDHRVDDAGGAHADVGDDQRPADADALAFGGQKLQASKSNWIWVM